MFLENAKLEFIIILISGFFIVPFLGWLHHNGYEKGYAAAQAEFQAALNQQADKAHQASAGYQAAKAKQDEKEKVKYVEVQKIIDRPVYRNQCFDADGVRIINEAARGK